MLISMAARSSFVTRASSQHSGSTVGALDASSWLSARSVGANGVLRWHAEIALDVIDGPAPEEFDEHVASRFHIDIYAEEWGFYFCHGGHASWIRVTDIPFVHGRDDFAVLSATPSLEHIGSLLRELEARYAIRFQRDRALVRTNVPRAEPSIREWVMAL
jgi:hypothetical protein